VFVVLSSLASDFARHAPTDWPDEWVLWLNFSLAMVSVVLSVLVVFKAERKLVELSQGMAFRLCVDVETAIRNGKLLTASLLVDELLDVVLPNLLRRRPIKPPQGTSPSLREVLHMGSIRAKRGEIGAAILDSGNESGEFARQFGCLAQALSTDMGETEFLDLRRCLLWLIEKSKPYRGATNTSLLKRLNLLGILTGVNLAAGIVLAVVSIVGIVTRPAA